MTRTTNHRDTKAMTQGHGTPPTATWRGDSCGTAADATTASREGTSASSEDVKATTKVVRGLTAEVPTSTLRSAIWTGALVLANRFRVIRTVDVAANCFPERDYKAALTAAQRAMPVWGVDGCRTKSGRVG